MFEHDWEESAVWTIRDQYLADPEAYDVVEIDRENLGNWMLHAQTFYRSPQELRRVLRRAEQIFAIAEQLPVDERYGLLPMLRRPAASGRMYYGGINLQNSPPAVRHAALGSHFSYDLRRSVFNWQISVLRRIVGEDDHQRPPHTRCTREFTQDREAVIQRLTECFRDSRYHEHEIPRVIKSAITAIGFGGRRSGGFVDVNNEFVPKGLATIIADSVTRQRFMSHPWMVEFIQEQDWIIKTITDAFLEDDPGWRSDPRAQRNGRYSAKVFISFLYQSMESRVMRALMDHFSDKKILLWVHDGFCTRHRVNIGDAHVIMHLDHGFPDWYLEETRHRGWRDPADPPPPTAEELDAQDQQDREQRHREELERFQQQGYQIQEDQDAEAARVRLAQLRARMFNY